MDLVILSVDNNIYASSGVIGVIEFYRRCESVSCRVLPENYKVAMLANNGRFNLVASWLVGHEINGDCYLVKENMDASEAAYIASTLVDILPNIKIAWPKIKEEV